MSDEKLIERATAQVYLIHGYPYAYAALTDFGNGKGLLQIHSDWGTYSAYWNAMGCSLLKFLTEANSSYIENNLARTANYMGMRKDAFVRLSKFMAHCWPRLVNEFRKDMDKL